MRSRIFCTALASPTPLPVPACSDAKHFRHERGAIARRIRYAMKRVYRVQSLRRVDCGDRMNASRSDCPRSARAPPGDITSASASTPSRCRTSSGDISCARITRQMLCEAAGPMGLRLGGMHARLISACHVQAGCTTPRCACAVMFSYAQWNPRIRQSARFPASVLHRHAASLSRTGSPHKSNGARSDVGFSLEQVVRIA